MDDFGLEPCETAFDSSSKRVAICEFLEDVKRRNSTKTNVIKDQNIGEFASIEPFSGVVWGLDPFIQSVLFIEPPALTCAGGAYPYIYFRSNVHSRAAALSASIMLLCCSLASSSLILRNPYFCQMTVGTLGCIVCDDSC